MPVKEEAFWALYSDILCVCLYCIF